ncbi:MAG TPA: MFS transporter, partial [Nocardioidaceae bacterium]|nr:MFS transporter [Nocardioidaceae bacterium]
LIALADSGGMVIAGRLIQGAAGATILACGLSLLSVGTSGDAQLRAVSMWGAAAAVGAAAGPLLGGVLVDVTGWQGLFWIDAGVAALCMVLTVTSVAESRDPDRPRSIDYAGTVLVALTLMPLILGFSKSGDWGWFSPATLLCFAVTVLAGYAFLHVERRVSIPLLDLALLRNRVLVGSTIAILIASGTINGLMYLFSLYFQDPATLGFSPLQAGLATLPATVGLVAVTPLVPRLTERIGGRQTIAMGFAITTLGFVVVGFTEGSWRYVAFFLPLIAIAVGMGLSNGPSSSAATAAVPPAQVGEASGVSNMARYVGAAVATALAATTYGTVSTNHRDNGESAASALSSGLGAASWLMAVFSIAGVVMALAVIARFRPGEGRGTIDDVLLAAASSVHTLPPLTAASAGQGTQDSSGKPVPQAPPQSPPRP